jgi:glycosyltransferase involved in cell wall biosynthesis
VENHVTVVIPVYNSAATVVPAIESVLAQTFNDFEVVAVNDGSTDTSAELLARYQSRIQIITQPNRGLSNARNAGIAAGAGKYVAFLDADDIWEPSMLERTVDALERNPRCVLAYGDVTVVDSEGRDLDASLFGDSIDRAPQFEELFTRLWPIMPSAAVMRREVFERIGGFAEAFQSLGYEDVYMWMLAREQGPFVYVPERLVKWRFSSFPRPLKEPRKEYKSARIFEKLVQDRWGKSAAPLIEARERAPRSILGYIGLRALHAGDNSTARTAYARAIRFDPWRMRNSLRYARTFLPAGAARALSGSSRAGRP